MSIFKKTPNQDGTVSPVAQPFNAYRAITASAERVNLKSAKEVQAIAKRQKSDKWQYDAWSYYEYIPEVHYSANLIADVLSRINVYPAYVDDTSKTPSSIKNMQKDVVAEELQREAINAMRLLETGTGGSSGVLRAMALNLFVSGECYLVKEPPTYSRGERWQIRSVHELHISNDGRQFSLKTRRDTKDTDLIPVGAQAYAARMWHNHPQYSDEADSSMRSVLDLCDQLLLVSRQERVHARSALNNGILFIPDELSDLSSPDGDMDNPLDETAHLSGDVVPSIEEDIMSSVMESVENEMSGSTVAPLIIRGPGDLGDQIKHITFQRDVDETTTAKTAALLDRILSGLAIPKDVAAGLSGVKYSNAVIIHETLYSSHIEPLILMICDQLTTAFLRPVLKSYGYTDEELRDVVVWYDPSAITAKPSKSEAANAGYDNKIISGEAWRRAHGFSDADAPTEEEIALRLALEKGLVSEAVMERILMLNFPNVFNGLRDDQLGAMNPEDAQAIDQAVGGAPAEGAPAPTQEIDTSDATDDVQVPEGLIE